MASVPMTASIFVQCGWAVQISALCDGFIFSIGSFNAGSHFLSAMSSDGAKFGCGVHTSIGGWVGSGSSDIYSCGTWYGLNAFCLWRPEAMDNIGDGGWLRLSV